MQAKVGRSFTSPASLRMPVHGAPLACIRSSQKASGEAQVCISKDAFAVKSIAMNGRSSYKQITQGDPGEQNRYLPLPAGWCHVNAYKTIPGVHMDLTGRAGLNKSLQCWQFTVLLGLAPSTLGCKKPRGKSAQNTQKVKTLSGVSQMGSIWSSSHQKCPHMAQSGWCWSSLSTLLRVVAHHPGGSQSLSAKLLITPPLQPQLRGANLQLTVDTCHAVTPPPSLVSPLLAGDRVPLTPIALHQHLAQKRLLLLRAWHATPAHATCQMRLDTSGQPAPSCMSYTAAGPPTTSPRSASLWVSVNQRRTASCTTAVRGAEGTGRLSGALFRGALPIRWDEPLTAPVPLLPVVM